jgi:hypothetical protein
MPAAIVPAAIRCPTVLLLRTDLPADVPLGALDAVWLPLLRRNLTAVAMPAIKYSYK